MNQKLNCKVFYTQPSILLSLPETAILELLIVTLKEEKEAWYISLLIIYQRFKGLHIFAALTSFLAALTRFLAALTRFLLH
jgi:hypothetical protein